jgi:RimJ/RimL family protein N-acetyltransferase
LTSLSDIELLTIESRVLWIHDERGRLVSSTSRTGARVPYLFIGTAHGSRTTAFGADLSDSLVDAQRSAIDADPAPDDPAQEPAALAECERLLNGELGPVARSAGRGWVIETVPEFSSDAQIVTSADAGTPAFGAGVPDGFTWEADEWHELIDGKLGDWAMCVVNGTPVSLCHSSRIADAGVEAGVWTHPDHRRRGYAAAATAAWASLTLSSAPYVFYSTNVGNRSSERVTERLGLRPIGWLWMLSPPISP